MSLLLLLSMLLILCWPLVVFGERSEASSQIGLAKLLHNDLKTLATSVDEIAETRLKLTLVLSERACSEVDVSWRLLTPASEGESAAVAAAAYDEVYSRVFGFQIVVEEQEQLVDREGAAARTRVSKKLYSSALIDSNRTRFLLTKLKRGERVAYKICLLVFIDATESVAFEKRCERVRFPHTVACNATTTTTTTTTTSSTSATTPALKSATATTRPINKSTTTATCRHSIKPDDNDDNYYVDNSDSESSSTASSGTGNHSLLLVALVICVTLLATNIFMFALIIIQNRTKLRYLRRRGQLLDACPPLPAAAHANAAYSHHQCLFGATHSEHASNAHATIRNLRFNSIAPRISIHDVRFSKLEPNFMMKLPPPPPPPLPPQSAFTRQHSLSTISDLTDEDESNNSNNNNNNKTSSHWHV